MASPRSTVPPQPTDSDAPPSRDSERALGVRGLSGDTALGFISALIGMVASLVAFSTFARQLGPERYGTLGAVYGITGLMLSLSSGGIVLAVLHDLTKSETRSSDAGSFLTLSVVLALVATAVVGLFYLVFVFLEERRALKNGAFTRPQTVGVCRRTTGLPLPRKS